MDNNKNAYELLDTEDKADQGKLNRRSFLKGTGAAVVSAAAFSAGLGLFAPSSHAARQIGKQGNATLLRMARDIYPHDRIPDKYYQQVVAPLAEESSNNAETLKVIRDGLKQLDTLSVDQHGKPYLRIDNESERTLLLKTIENTDFFQKIKGALLMGIYNNPELWPHFGYGGSSWEKGGYRDDPSYGKLDWI